MSPIPNSIGNWKAAAIPAGASVLDAIQAIDRGRMQIALVVNENGHLIGTVTDGDVRRGILSGLALSAPAGSIMNISPVTGDAGMTNEQMLSLMRMKDIHQLPLVDSTGQLTGVEVLASLWLKIRQDNQVVLMAGGFGKRLKERTADCPKPLLEIGRKPILETILDSFVEHGFYKFTISLGYRGQQIADYFGNGSRWGVEINYVYEKEPLGTAGALSLLPERPIKPFFIMNGDVLTKVNFRQLLRFHEEQNQTQKALATMCVRGFEHMIPYGVIKLDGTNIQSIEEKPVQNVMVSAGIYMLEPDALEYIPMQQYFDMPSLFDMLIRYQKPAAAFPIHEYWMDVGHPEDFERADREYDQFFAEGV